MAEMGKKNDYADSRTLVRNWKLKHQQKRNKKNKKISLANQMHIGVVYYHPFYFFSYLHLRKKNEKGTNQTDIYNMYCN